MKEARRRKSQCKKVRERKNKLSICETDMRVRRLYNPHTDILKHTHADIRVRIEKRE